MAKSGAEGLEKLEDMIVRAAETTAAHVRAAKAGVGTVIFGQEQVVEHALITILSGGHALLVGVPGLAKTKLVETMGIVLGLDARRIQFTPDLMPSDILGSEVLEESPGGKRNFRFIPGPVFAQLLMADEINRASPRTQSALLQRCRSSTSPSRARATMCPSPSMCWRRRTRWSRKAPTRSPKRSSTASSCRST
jgi:MoxR-like ATPase